MGSGMRSDEIDGNERKASPAKGLAAIDGFGDGFRRVLLVTDRGPM